MHFKPKYQYSLIARSLIAFLIVGGCFFHLHAQRARLFSTDIELSSSLVNSIHQDNYGIIWIATEDGLNRYDGSKFITYKQNSQNTSILHNLVRLVYETKKDEIFVGYFSGLQQYNVATDDFTNIPIVLQNSEIFPAHVLSILERKNGDILVGTSGHGVFIISGEEGQKYANQISGLVPSTLINYLFEDSDENLWVSTQDKGLFRVGKQNQEVTHFSQVGNNISSICQDLNGEIYAGSLSRGLFRLNKAIDAFEPVEDASFSNFPIKVLQLTQRGEILVGSDGEGVKIFNPTTKLGSSLSFNVSNFDLSKLKVHSIMEDNSGNIWLGIYQKGVLLVPARIDNFKYIGYHSVRDNIIGSNYVTSFASDHNGYLWVGTDGDGLYVIDIDGGFKKHYAHTESEGSIPATVMCVFEDSNNDIWVGTYLKGLFKLNKRTDKFENQPLFDFQSNPVHRIFDITEDNNKNLWIGSLGTGVFSLNLTNQVVKNYDVSPNPKFLNDARGTINNSWVNTLCVSKDNRLYIGSSDGICYLDLVQNEFVRMNAYFPSILRQMIYSIFEDSSGILWVATSQGLKQMNPLTFELKDLTTNEGLPSNSICSIQEDSDANIWVSTNAGITKYNVKENAFINYYFHDGLQGNEFSKRASTVDRKGNLFFGGINGISYFKPEEIKETIKNLEVKITDFYIHDQAVRQGMKSGKYDIVKSSVLEAKSFELSHFDNSFSIEFSTMEMVNPGRIIYLYTLDGKSWISLQRGTNMVTFNNLEAGDYTFQVKAKDFNTYSDPVEISVKIHPAWYFSFWAKLAYFIVWAMLVYFIYVQIMQRVLTRKRLREHLHNRQINEAKLEFFTNVAHEIRTPISLIINPLKKLIETDTEVTRQKAYTVMRRNSEKILHLINQLMDIRKIDRGQVSMSFRELELVSIIKETCEMFEEQILAKELSFQMDFPNEPINGWIDPRFFDKILQNVLSNAVKFTPINGSIDVNVKTVQKIEKEGAFNEYVEIIVSDSGIGLKEEDLQKIFDRFYQSENNNEHKNFGTGIGLHLTRSIVEMHHGSITAENNLNGIGSKFIISIPLGRSHLSKEELDSEDKSVQTSTIKVEKPLSVELLTNEKVKSKSKYWVLIVDDDPEIRNYISGELSIDYHTMESVNGKKAFAIILEKKPDLIISDVMMPEMDGITLCKKVKQNLNVNHIPIVLLTAKSAERDNFEGLGIGADAYIPKPFNMELLKKTVDNIIRNRELLKNNFSGNQEQSDKLSQIDFKTADEKLMQKIMDFIDANISNPDLNVEMIAEYIGISRVHLYRRLKEITNQSVRDLIRNVRLRQAADLLSSKNINIAEVAYATGFPNPSKFSTSFKEFFGMTPKTYADKHFKADNEIKNQ
jgi:signal transduction histidine kinase/ligand-binding sensor domain-containing protein/AraC-like DNA-binding protein